MPAAHAQSKTPASETPSRLRTPSFLEQNLKAVGDRLSAPGKERLALSGTLADSQGTASIQLLYELPGRLVIEQSGKRLTFDGKTAWSSAGSVTPREEDVLESLASDSPEGFFAAITAGAHLRPLGLRYRADDGSNPNYQGPWFDVYELLVAVRERGSVPVRTKWYYFDSETGLLVKVRYLLDKTNPSTLVETSFSGWQSVAGQFAPGRITRLEKGTEVLTFQASSMSLGARQNDGLFARGQ